MRYLLGELFYKALPLVVGAIGLAGGCCFAALAPAEVLDRTAALSISFAGALGSSGVAATLVKVRRRAAAWEVCGLRRNTVTFLICVSWLFGAIGGLLIFFFIPRGLI